MSSKFLGKKRFRKARKNSSEGFGFFKRVNNGVWFCFVGGVEWSGVGKLYSFFFGVMKCWLKPTILVKVGSYPWRKMCDLGSEGITFKSFPEKNGATKKFHDTGCFIGILIMLCSNPRTIGQHYPLHTLNNQFFFQNWIWNPDFVLFSFKIFKGFFVTGKIWQGGEPTPSSIGNWFPIWLRSICCKMVGDSTTN